MGQSPLPDEAGQSGEQAEIHRHRRGQRPGGRVRRGDAERAGLQREVLLFPRLATARTQYRGARRDQRSQELSQRRRQRVSPVLRYGQGRGFPGTGSQRLPAGADQRANHRSVRGARCAVREGVRRAPRQPIIRRRCKT